MNWLRRLWHRLRGHRRAYFVEDEIILTGWRDQEGHIWIDEIAVEDR